MLNPPFLFPILALEVGLEGMGFALVLSYFYAPQCDFTPLITSSIRHKGLGQRT